jgi:psiF repeat
MDLPYQVVQPLAKTETMMKKIIAAVLLLTPLAFHSAHAATEQQNKMATCNKDAAGKKGDERKAFMKECLSNKPMEAASPQKAQQNKMKTCNADAKDMKGDERKAFMKDCLKKG